MLVFTYTEARYYPTDASEPLSTETLYAPCTVDSHTFVDEPAKGGLVRLVVGTSARNLLLFVFDPALIQDSNGLKFMSIVLLGRVAQPEALSYIGEGVLYLGSRRGNSGLLRMVPENELESPD